MVYSVADLDGKMGTLIIPDLHDKSQQAQAILDSEQWDKAVLCGDVFDDFTTDVREAVVTANWLQETLKNPDITCLWGNHDLHYAWLWPWLRCSGYSPEKQQAILLTGIESLRTRFRFHVWVDGWLITHAGLDNRLLSQAHYRKAPFRDSTSMKAFADWLVSEEQRCFDCLQFGLRHPWLQAGRDRGGDAPVGGLVWSDVRSFQPIPGINQLFGHTPSYNVREVQGRQSRNVCIDTNLRHYAVIENGELTVKETGAC